MAEGKSKTGVVKKRASKREKKDWIAAYIFIAPVTLGLLVFYIWPFIQNIWFSFNEVSKFNVATFCGLANYQKLFQAFLNLAKELLENAQDTAEEDVW